MPADLYYYITSYLKNSIFKNGTINLDDVLLFPQLVYKHIVSSLVENLHLIMKSSFNKFCITYIEILDTTSCFV